MTSIFENEHYLGRPCVWSFWFSGNVKCKNIKNYDKYKALHNYTTLVIMSSGAYIEMLVLINLVWSSSLRGCSFASSHCGGGDVKLIERMF